MTHVEIILLDELCNILTTEQQQQKFILEVVKLCPTTGMTEHTHSLLQMTLASLYNSQQQLQCLFS